MGSVTPQLGKMRRCDLLCLLLLLQPSPCHTLLLLFFNILFSPFLPPPPLQVSRLRCARDPAAFQLGFLDGVLQYSLSSLRRAMGDWGVAMDEDSITVGPGSGPGPVLSRGIGQLRKWLMLSELRFPCCAADAQLRTHSSCWTVW